MLMHGGRTAPFVRRALGVTPIWVVCSIWMWSWWLNPDRINYTPLYIPLTAALFYEFALLPSIFLYFIFRAKVPKNRIAQKNLKVAVISLCVPSKESIDIVEKQLIAMKGINYPNDCWILDEGGSRRIMALAKKYKVNYFTRKNIPKYNQPEHPFQAKTKAGNVNAWLDHVKRRKYEYFVQFDIDHLANENYLDKTLGHFRDKKVAWVQAPSVYKNRDSWVARGATEQELVLQGPLQMGFYGHSETPFIIGSHCTYRMSAIREIGGFQPTRAEDHLDTVMLASAGYKGVFVPEILAEGDGPDTLNTYLAQQFAWAYSMFQVLLHHTPNAINRMPLRKKWQFLFAQTWYPMWSFSYMIMFLCPIVALLINADTANVSGNEFFVHFGPLFACAFLIWWASRPLMQPKNIGLTWRGMILHVVRWPIIIRAIFSALFKIKKSYMITPKGKHASIGINTKVYRPFLFLGLANALAIIISSMLYGSQSLEGQTVFALTNAMFMAVICVVDVNLRLRLSQIKFKNISAQWLKPVSAIAVLLVFISSAIVSSPVINNSISSAIVPDPEIVLETTAIPKPYKQMSSAELREQIAKIPISNINQTPEFGLYNPEKTFATNNRHIRHSFAGWDEENRLAYELFMSLSSQNLPLITIEPTGESDGSKLLNDISTGKYDSMLEDLALTLGSTDTEVYIRFAHEMELAKLYPWGNQNPNLYKSAYTYVVDYMRNHGAENTKWVWSPAGNIGSEKYYPGDRYVDVIGVTILYDEYFYGNLVPDFAELSRTRKLLFGLGKPIWIVEYGAGSKNPNIQRRVIEQSVSNYKSAGFQSLVYLNIPDSNIDGPDYSIDNKILTDIFYPKTIDPSLAEGQIFKLDLKNGYLDYILCVNSKTILIDSNCQ